MDEFWEIFNGDTKKLFAGGTDENIIRNENENVIIFTSHEDGIDKLTKILKNEKVDRLA